MTRAFQETALAADIAAGLARVETLFDSQLSSVFPAVNELCRYVERYRGKMLRPTLVLVSGLAFTDDGEPLRAEHDIVAATVEMIHMATLVHDDVLDEAAVRRRGETVNFLRGNETAVMLGDYLISNAFHLCSRAVDRLMLRGKKRSRLWRRRKRFFLRRNAPIHASCCLNLLIVLLRAITETS